MGILKDTRAQLVADLQVIGIPVTDDWAIRADPPCIYVTPPPSDYLEPGQTFGHSFVMNLDVVVLVESQSANADRDELENLVEEVLRNTADWALAGVDPPGTTSLSESTFEFLHTTVHLGKELHI